MVVRLWGNAFAIVAMLAIMGSAFGQAPVAVSETEVSEQDLVSLELSQMEIHEAMAALSQATGYSILVSKAINAKINAFIVDMPPEQALEQTVRVNGFYYEKNGNVVWVLSPEEYFEDFNLGRARRIVPLQHARAQDVALVLEAAKSKQGVITAFTDTNVVVISEVNDRIDELEGLAKSLDVAPKTRVYQLENAAALDMLALLQPHATTETTLRADMRTNQILIAGTEATIVRLEGLLREFDKPEKIKTRVYALKYAKAEATAELLREILTGRKQSAQSMYGEQNDTQSQRPGTPRVFTTEPGRGASPTPSAPTGAPQAPASAPAAPAPRSAPPSAATPGASWQQYRGATRAAAAGAAGAATASADGAPAMAGQGEEAGIGPLATITADTRTNSVVVTHVQSVLDRVEQILLDIDIPNKLHMYQFRNIDPTEIGIEARLASLLGEAQPFVNVDPITRKVTFRCPDDEGDEVLHLLQEWDQAVPQVHIEAEILSVNVRLLNELGINWQVVVDHMTNGDEVTTFQSLFQFPANIATETPQTRVSIGNVEHSDYNVVIQAIARDSDTEVIAQPKITVRSGQEAVFSNVRDEPYTVVTVAGETQTTMQDVRFLNVGTSLMVAPIINENNQVTVDVQLELSDLVEVRDNVPVVDRATAQSSVTIANGGAVILGGLRQHSRSKIERGTPGLRKLPVLGALFRNRQRNRLESEIVLILRPLILGDNEPVEDACTIKQEIDTTLKLEGKTGPGEVIELLD